jgi:hypothetical protein
MKDEIQNYTALRERMHEALAAEHPEWIEADGGSPMLDFYDARFAELLTMLQSPAGHRPTMRAASEEDTPFPTRGITPRAKYLKRM